MKKDAPFLFSLGRNQALNDVLCVYSFIRRNIDAKQINISNIYNKIFIRMMDCCIKNGIDLFSDHDTETIKLKFNEIKEFYLNSSESPIDSYTNRAPKWHNALSINKHKLRKTCQEKYGVTIKSIESYVPFMITKIWCPDVRDETSFPEFVQETSNHNDIRDLIRYHESNLKSSDPVVKNNAYSLLLMKSCRNYYFYMVKKIFNDFSSAKFLNQMIDPDHESGFVEIPGKIVFNDFMHYDISGNNIISCDYYFNYVLADCTNEWRLYSFSRKYTVLNNDAGDHQNNKWRNQIFPDSGSELYLGREVLISGEIKGKINLTSLDMWAWNLDIASIYLL